MINKMSSFTSYISQAEENDKRDKKLTLAYEKVYRRPEEEVNEKLLPGEIAIGHAKQVIKYSIHEDPSRGTSGTLVCTNFRVIFITPERLAHDLNELQNKLLGKQDILLNSIDSIYVEYTNKRKRLVPLSKVKEGIKRLEIHCKNFRVAAFNFKFTLMPEEQKVVNAILYHAYPVPVSHLFAFDFEHKEDISKVCDIPLYRSSNEWGALLKEYHIEQKWRVSHVNQNFVVSETMGEYFVVPYSVTDSTIANASNQFCNNRLPVWCWTSKSGCSLTRSAELRLETELGQLEAVLHSEIQKASKKNTSLKILEVGKLCPTYTQIQQSFLKLKNVCMPASAEEYVSSDSGWFLSLQTSKWLQHVSTFLTLACEAVEGLTEKDHNIIVREQSGIDITPVLTSLIQLIADCKYRTLVGFQSLIQREWVIGGFPFLDRLGHLHQPSKQTSVISSEAETTQNMSPVFLLFLDCVSQLLKQCPSAFEFTSTFLTVLHDGTRMTMFDTFIFNNERNRRKTINASEKFQLDRSWQTLPFWSWSLQYEESDMKLFNNPLYRLHSLGLHNYVDLQAQPRSIRTLSQISCSIRLNLTLDVVDNNVHQASLSSPNDSSEKTKIPIMPRAQSLLDVPVIDPGPEDLQVHYNSKTGVMAIVGTETPESDKKKRGPWSIRRKKGGKDKELFDDDNVSSDTIIPADLYLTTIKDISRLPPLDSYKTRDRLHPRCRLSNMHLWNSCYLRWNIWSQLFGGGPTAVYQQQSILFDEVYSLHAKVKKLEKQLGLDQVDSNEYNDSDMYFRHTSSQSSENGGGDLTPGHSDTPTFLSNFFPYSPKRDMGRKFVVGYPLRTFVRTRSKQHTRSQSDFTITTPNSDGNLSSASRTAALPTVSSSMDNLHEAETRMGATARSKYPKKALMPPDRPLLPPKESITYVTSV